MKTEHLSLSDLTNIYRIMLLSRKFEEKIVELFHSGKTRCFTPHLGIGEEAVSVGAFYGLSKQDLISPHYRGATAAWLVRKLPATELMCIYLGKKSTGLANTMAVQWTTNMTLNVIGMASSILGGGIEIAVGAALGAKLGKTGQVVVNSFGDGTTNRGNFHEALNLAAVFRLPIVFVCQNNQWAMNMRVAKAVTVGKISKRAVAYGFPGITVDGNDVLAVHQTVQEAVQRARDGLGPTLVEAVTYRMSPHSERDPDQYRAEAERRKWRRKCPILRLEATLKAKGMPQEELLNIQQNAADEIAKAVDEALSRPDLTPEDRLQQWSAIYREIYI
ncbi:MAG: thiamine pyrophosphate-dependent dehydrogenase E1 component subunit alpha [Chloroflexi bacterium]|nr:thiamine pyrophosphate-dependent dehydrogenase E1 component subunit alpha [Chloroflexota bacterium]